MSLNLTPAGEPQSIWPHVLPANVYSSGSQRLDVGLEVIGSQFRVFLGGRWMGTVINSDISHGRDFALSVENGSQAQCTVYYDDLRIYGVTGSAPVKKPSKKQSSSKAKFSR